MAKKEPSLPSKPETSLVVPSPRSRREELLDVLLANTTNSSHVRILNAYLASGTVEGAEQEFAQIIEDIVNEA